MLCARLSALAAVLALTAVPAVALGAALGAAANQPAAAAAGPISCEGFHSKLACDLHPLLCRWSRPNKHCRSKSSPPPPPAPPSPPGPPGPPAARTALFWLEPYANLTTVASYTAAWSQFGANKRPGYSMPCRRHCHLMRDTSLDPVSR